MKNHLRDSLIGKLDAGLTELQARCNESNVKASMRMYGYCLGLRVALMEVNKEIGNNVFDFPQYDVLAKMIHDNFGEKKTAELKEYKIPRNLDKRKEWQHL